MGKGHLMKFKFTKPRPLKAKSFSSAIRSVERGKRLAKAVGEKREGKG